MNRAKWNGLRVGDRVFMHNRAKALCVLVPGVVATVNKGAAYNGVGLRVARVGAGTGTIAWPSPPDVHWDASDELCPRCQLASTEQRELTQSAMRSHDGYGRRPSRPALS